MKGGMARFINHSCEPNCVTEKWVVGAELRVGIFAKELIHAGTELCYHYRLDWNRGAKVKCVSYYRKCCARHHCHHCCADFHRIVVSGKGCPSGVPAVPGVRPEWTQ